LFFAPFVFRRRIGHGRRFWAGSLYFVAIGLGFMLIEASWLQRLVLYLGHPSRATTVGLAAILAGAGLGSMASSRLDVDRAVRAGWLVPLALAAVTLGLEPLFAATVGAPLAARVVIAVAVLSPAAFFMGFCFPVGMARFGGPSNAWFWALNGAAGVLSGALSLALAMELGLERVGLLGCTIYVCACGLANLPKSQDNSVIMEPSSH
ncbi:MAG: hypothetical protein JNK82_28145, partial [Myxococcaceae bacterium]|nr:hypothetical protein [Myxococcaceae bacterium]